jgi:hypothetical protein
MRDTPLCKQMREPALHYSPDHVCFFECPISLGKLISRDKAGTVGVSKHTRFNSDSIPHLVNIHGDYDLLLRLLSNAAAHDTIGVLLGQPRAEFAQAYAGGKTCIRRAFNADPKKSPPGYEPCRRRVVPLDFDTSVALPEGMGLLDNVPAAVQAAIATVEPFLPGLEDATLIVQLTSQSGLHIVPGHPAYGRTGPELVRMRLWLILDRDYDLAEIKRWVNVANAAWAGDSKLIDTAPLQPVGINYTADPQFIDDVPDPLPGKRWWIWKRARPYVTPVIPLAEAAEKVIRDSGKAAITDAPTYAAALEMIGDYCFAGKQGFYGPIMSATRHAADAGIALNQVITDVQMRALGFRGNRSESGDFAQYVTPGFIAGKYHGWVEKRAAQALEAERRLKLQTPAPVAALPVQEARDLLAREAARIIRECLLHAMRNAAYERLRGLVESDIKIEKAPGYSGTDPASVVWHLRHAAERSGRLSQFTKVVEDEDGTPMRKPVAKAMKAAVMAQLGLTTWHRRAPAFLVRVTLGAGKTHTFVTELLKAIRALTPEERAMLGGGVDWLAPDYKLIDEVAQKHFGEPDGIILPRIIRGRPATNPHNPKTTMCQRLPVTNAIAHAGQPVTRTVCDADPERKRRACAMRQTCAYFTQIAAHERRLPINLMAHAMLKIPRRQDLPPAVMTVIDETPIKGLFKVEEFSTDVLWNADRVRDLLHANASEEHVSALMDLAGGLRELLWSPVRGGMGRIPCAENAVELLRGDFVETDAENDEHIIQRATAQNVRDRRTLLRLGDAYLACLPKGVDLNEVVQVSGDGRSLRLSSFDPPAMPKGHPVIVLDATADARLLSDAFGRKFETIVIDAHQNLHVTQVTGCTGSKSSLWGTRANRAIDPSERGAIEANLDRTMDRILKIAGVRKTLVVTHKETREYLENLDLPENIHLGHYGAIRGIDEFNDVHFIVLLGRQLPALHDLEYQRAAMAAVVESSDHETALRYLEKYRHINHKQYMGYFISPTTGELFHPDPITNALLAESSTNEMIQAIGRGRAVGRREALDVLVITDHVIPGLKPDATVRWADFRKARHETKIAKHLVRALFENADFNAVRVAALSNDEMMAISPDIFRSPRSATNARQRDDAITKDGFKVSSAFLALADYVERWIAQIIVEGDFRRAGQTGSPSLFVAAMPKTMMREPEWWMRIVEKMRLKFGSDVKIERWTCADAPGEWIL